MAQKQYSGKLDEALLDAVDAKANSLGITRNKLIKQAIELYLEQNNDTKDYSETKKLAKRRLAKMASFDNSSLDIVEDLVTYCSNPSDLRLAGLEELFTLPEQIKAAEVLYNLGFKDFAYIEHLLSLKMPVDTDLQAMQYAMPKYSIDMSGYRPDGIFRLANHNLAKFDYDCVLALHYYIAEECVITYLKYETKEIRNQEIQRILPEFAQFAEDSATKFALWQRF